MRASFRYYIGASFLVLTVLLFINLGYVYPSWRHSPFPKFSGLRQGLGWNDETATSGQTLEKNIHNTRLTETSYGFFSVSNAELRVAATATPTMSLTPSSLPAETPTGTSLATYSKIIVIGKLQRENTDWVSERLPE